MRAVRLACGTLLSLLVAASVHAASEATLFRLFLNDGASLVSFGEFARIDDRVIFSMPIGGTADQPRLYVVTVPAAQIDWKKTDDYAASARVQWYAARRGEEDFQLLSAEVARVLNEVALAPDPRRGLEIAENARRMLAEWPRAHFGYRQSEVREIVSLLDETLSDLRAATGVTRFELALVADAPDVPLQPLLGIPSAREQVDQVFRVAQITERAADRVALYQAALVLLAESASAIPSTDLARYRKTAETHIRLDTDVDARYADLTRRVMTATMRAAADARVSDVEALLNQIPKEDARLGRRRPEAIQALRASVQAQLENARRFRLLRDQWDVRRALYREYQRSAGVQLLQLAKLQPNLEAIRRLDGPPPRTLESLQKRLKGGADRLQRIGVSVPQDLRAAHDLLIAAWRFAESAVNARYKAVTSGSVTTAWEASSAAAGALLLLNRAQHEIQQMVEPPKLQ